MGDIKTNPEMPPTEGTAPFEVSVPIGISVADFSTVMASINGLYKEVGKELGAINVTDLLVSRHREGSLVIECNPILADDADPLEAGLVSKTMLDGLEQLTRGKRPANFTNTALRYVAKLSSVTKDDSIAVIVGGGGRSITCAHNLEAIARGLINLKTMSWGSAEGVIQMISVRGSPKFSLYEVLTDEKISCNIDKELIEDVKKSLGHRVVVYGEIHRKGDEFEYVKVEEIRRRPPSEELPGFDDIRGIFADSDDDET